MFGVLCPHKYLLSFSLNKKLTFSDFLVVFKTIFGILHKTPGSQESEGAGEKFRPGFDPRFLLPKSEHFKIHRWPLNPLGWSFLEKKAAGYDHIVIFSTEIFQAW